MARKLKVDPESAIQAAMVSFWKHGFENLGTRQLEKETGITRFSLQTRYNGKMELYLTALDNYLDMFDAHGRPGLNSPTLDGLADWFAQRANPETMPEMACFGCMMINAMVEFQNNNPQVNLRRDRFLGILQYDFAEALSQARIRGELNTSLSDEALREILVAGTLSLNVLARSRGSNATVKPMATGYAHFLRTLT